MKIIHQPWWQRLGVQPERSQPYDEEGQGEPKLQVFKIYVFMGLTAEVDFCFLLFYSWLLMIIIEIDACFLFKVIFCCGLSVQKIGIAFEIAISTYVQFLSLK